VPDNYVDITVRAKGDKATEFDLENLKGKLNELGRMVETARVDLAGDKQAQVTLARLDAKLLGWGRRIETAKVKLKVDGVARAEADLMGVSLALDSLAASSALASGAADALAVSEEGVAVGEASAASAGAGAAAVVAAIAGAATIAVVALMPLAAALALVGAGFVGLAAVAVPMISKVITARTALQAAEAKYDAATTKAQRAAALKAEAAATAGLTSAQKSLMGPMDQIAAMFHKLTKAVAPNIVHAFAGALKVIKDLMPALTPLVKAAADALAGFFANVDNWLRSSSGKKFLNWVKTEGPQDIANFGKFMWAFARDAGSAFKRIVDAGRMLDRFFTQTIPAAFQLAVDEVIRTWDLLVIGAIRTVLHISNAFGLLPGPLGAPFRKASAAIQKSLDQMEANVRATTARIQADINRLHGKTIQILTVYTQHGFPGGVGPGSTGVGVAPPPSGGPSNGTLSASVLGGPSGVAEHPFMAPAPYYGPRRITNQLIPSGHWPQHHTISNGAELIGILAALLSQYARTHHGGSAQQAFGYGPG
jgi:hypothetical protein